MGLDLVHDIQGAYRKVLNSMSRPGTIESLDVEFKVDIEIPCYKSTFLIMLMLLDGEVTFNVMSKNKEEMSKMINQITYSKERNLAKADYVFLLSDEKEDKISSLYKNCKSGDLVDPNKAATIIIEVESLSNEDELRFSGPGVNGFILVSINKGYDWVKAREARNVEFPLGIDTIFVDKKGQVMCIPRTTKIVFRESET